MTASYTLTGERIQAAVEPADGFGPGAVVVSVVASDAPERPPLLTAVLRTFDAAETQRLGRYVAGSESRMRVQEVVVLLRAIAARQRLDA